MNRLTLILIVCVAIAAALFMFHDDGAIIDRERAGEAFLPALLENVNDAESLIVEKNGERIELERRDDNWVVASKGGYPAKFEAIRGLLVSLARLTDAEPRTNRPDRFSELMLEKEGDAAGTRVTIKGKGGSPLADLVVGKARWQPSQAVYLRRAGEDQAYLLEGNVRAQPQLTTWVDMNVVKWPAAEVTGLMIGGDLSARLVRDETGAIVLQEGLPEGRELSSSAPFSALFSVLTRLDFADVKPASETPGTPLRTLTFSTDDGGTVVLRLFRDDAEKTWAHLEAKASEPTASTAPASPTVSGPPAPEGAAGDPGAASQQLRITSDQAATWQSAWSPWAFELPAYRVTTLLATWDDWLEPLPEVEEVDETTSE